MCLTGCHFLESVNKRYSDSAENLYTSQKTNENNCHTGKFKRIEQRWVPKPQRCSADCRKNEVAWFAAVPRLREEEDIVNVHVALEQRIDIIGPEVANVKGEVANVPPAAVIVEVATIVFGIVVEGAKYSSFRGGNVRVIFADVVATVYVPAAVVVAKSVKPVPADAAMVYVPSVEVVRVIFAP